MTTDDETPCRFDKHCRARTQGVPAPADGRGLCWADERHGEHILREFPHRYRALAAELGKDTARPSLGQLHAIRAEAPIPIREHIDALVREIVHELTTWEGPVREVARLSDVPERGVRFQVAVNRAAMILSEHYSVLLALPSTSYVPYGGGVDELDGPGVVVRLAGLFYRVERTLGTTLAKEPRPGRCPGCWLDEITQPDGTVTSALVWTVGDDNIRCRSCGWPIRLADYTGYLMAFTPEAARKALAS